MFILRGRNGKELVREDFDELQHEAYMTLLPMRDDGADSVYELIAYLPSGGYVKCEATFYRGSNALGMPKAFADKVWPMVKKEGRSS